MWEKLKRKMRKRFISENYRQENYLKFYNFKQADLSVQEILEFEFLMLKCDMVEPEEQTITHFLGGLKKEITNVIWLQFYWMFNNVRKLAMNEQQHKGESKATSRPFFSNQKSASSSDMTKFVKGTS